MLTEVSRRCLDARLDAAQAQAPHLRGLLLPQEPPLRPRAERDLRDVPAQPPRGPRAPAPARASYESSTLGIPSCLATARAGGGDMGSSPGRTRTPYPRQEPLATAMF